MMHVTFGETEAEKGKEKVSVAVWEEEKALPQHSRWEVSELQWEVGHSIANGGPHHYKG